jgi:hypothetical protein
MSEKGQIGEFENHRQDIFFDKEVYVIIRE